MRKTISSLGGGQKSITLFPQMRAFQMRNWEITGKNEVNSVFFGSFILMFSSLMVFVKYVVFNYALCVCGKERRGKAFSWLFTQCLFIRDLQGALEGTEESKGWFVYPGCFPWIRTRPKKVRRILTRTDSHQKSQGVEESLERARCILSA